LADHITRLAQQRIIKISAELEAELAGVRQSGPTLEILRRLRTRAAESLSAMAFINIFEEKGKVEFLTMQNEVKRYDEFVGWLKELITEGISFDNQMTADDREEMLDILMQTPQGQRDAIELGLVDVENRDA
jgi:hypothetical protein